MSSFKRILVGLDMVSADEKLIEYAALLSKCVKPEKICFLHVQHDAHLPDSIRQSYPVLNEAPDEQIRQQMEARVLRHTRDMAETAISCIVTAGIPRKEMLRQGELQRADLVIIGRKRESHGSGIIPQHLAHKAPFSLLIVPENAPLRISHILVPTDFSSYARAALAHAQAIARATPGTTIRCQHVYSVPYGYFKTGLTEPEFAAVMHKNAVDDYEAFIASLSEQGAGIGEPLFTYNTEQKSPAVLIHAAAHQREADLIVAGARGLNAATAFFLGSVADKLIQLEQDIPLLLVKDES